VVEGPPPFFTASTGERPYVATRRQGPALRRAPRRHDQLQPAPRLQDL